MAKTQPGTCASRPTSSSRQCHLLYKAGPVGKAEPDLLVEEGGPLVGHKLVVELIMVCHLRYKPLHLRRHVVLDEPELYRISA